MILYLPQRKLLEEQKCSFNPLNCDSQENTLYLLICCKDEIRALKGTNLLL